MTMNMTHNMVMIKINIAEAKAHLSKYIKRVEAGHTVVLARRNQPVAEIRPIGRASLVRRPIGLCAGEFSVPSNFDEPLPAAVLETFEGR